MQLTSDTMSVVDLRQALDEKSDQRLSKFTDICSIRHQCLKGVYRHRRCFPVQNTPKVDVVESCLSTAQEGRYRAAGLRHHRHNGFVVAGAKAKQRIEQLGVESLNFDIATHFRRHRVVRSANKAAGSQHFNRCNQRVNKCFKQRRAVYITNIESNKCSNHQLCLGVAQGGLGTEQEVSECDQHTSLRHIGS